MEVKQKVTEACLCLVVCSYVQNVEKICSIVMTKIQFLMSLEHVS